jgi:hypothetical protein
LRNFKIPFYVNLYADNLFKKQKRIGYFITVGVIVWRDNEHRIVIKENDGDGWSFDDVVLLVERMQNREAVEWWGE